MKNQRVQFAAMLMLAVVFCISAPLAAREIDGVHLPESIELAGNRIILNGAGIRTKFFFHVYVGGLYLQKKTHDAAAIITGDAPMLMRMHFIYDGVSPEEMQHGWQKGFRWLAPDADAALKQAMGRYTNLFSVTVKENDTYDIGWLPDRGLEVRLNGNILDVIDSFDLKKVLFTIWLGKDPADGDLKEGLLGKNK